MTAKNLGEAFASLISLATDENRMKSLAFEALQLSKAAEQGSPEAELLQHISTFFMNKRTLALGGPPRLPYVTKKSAK